MDWELLITMRVFLISNETFDDLYMIMNFQWWTRHQWDRNMRRNLEN